MIFNFDEKPSRVSFNGVQISKSFLKAQVNVFMFFSNVAKVPISPSSLFFLFLVSRIWRKIEEDLSAKTYRRLFILSVPRSAKFLNSRFIHGLLATDRNFIILDDRREAIKVLNCTTHMAR